MVRDSGRSAHPYGVGFKNSAERLAALYGDDAHMSVGARPYGPGFVVVVFLPFRKAPGARYRGTSGGRGMTMRAIIVDDEELARRGIRALLKRAGDVEIVSECGNVDEAIRAISATEPELVYLDIQMQGNTGFDIIAALPGTKCPHVIFVTAFDRFAVRAFEIHALDYLLKPVNEGRFNASLARARAAVAGARDGSMIRRFWQMATELRASPGQNARRRLRIEFQ